MESHEETRGNSNKDIEIKVDKESLKKGFQNVGAFFSQKKVVNILIIVFLLALIVAGVWIRTQNVDLLKDATTGEYIPVALDPFYFLRMSETIIENGGLPDSDPLKFRPGLPVGWSTDILPKVNVILFKSLNLFFEDLSLRNVNILSPVIFFAVSIILFFFLILNLTKSKIAAGLGSIFLTIIPSYLYRTMAGFSDHESIGMMSFFAVLLMFVFSMKKLHRQNKLNKVVLYGIITGLLTTLVAAAWAGITKFVFMIIPVSFFLIWIIRFQKQEDANFKKQKNYIVFYFLWVLFAILFSPIFGYPISKMISNMTSPSSVMTFITLLFMISDYSILKYKNKINFVKKKYLEKYRIIFSLIISGIVGAILLSFVGFNVFDLIGNLVNTLIRPFGGGRVGNTVAENAEPYLTTWISQIGKILVWLFYFGMVFLGIEFSKGISKKKYRIGFSAVWIILISGILFSRVSQSALFNGNNFISKFVYFGSLILFAVYFIWVYFKDEIKVKNEFIVMMVWAFFILIAGRSAVRLFFIVTPLICLMSGFSVSKLYDYSRKSKDELLKVLMVLVLLAAIVGVIFSGISLTKATINQAKNTGPSANPQWQKSMSWVRENTAEDSKFLHWWDYGYWVQYLGERATLADGGHFQGDFRTHMIGRYVLTNPEPESAMSFMKSNNVSYLLIDPTDLGKYSAYSSIGSDDNNDRTSYIPVIPMSQGQTQETRNGIMRVYQGGSVLDSDIVYNRNGSEIFLPANKAGVGGFLIEEVNDSLSQPQGVFVYNGQQYTLPIRYLYYGDELIDFGKGVNSTIMIIPSFTGSQIEQEGAIVYLSSRTMNSLFAQLYLMEDPKDLYPTLKVAHKEDNQITAALKSQGLNLGDFVYYQGFRGPIKIWDTTEIPENILDKEEFRRMNGEWAEFDDLVVTR